MCPMIELVAQPNSVLLPVKVVPGASRTRFVGEWNGRARFAVAAPAEKGKANAVLVAFLAEKLGVRRGDVTIAQGASSPSKMVCIRRVTVEHVRGVLTLGTA